METLKDYDDETINKMIMVYNNYLKQKEYRRSYYGNKYKNDLEYRNKKKLENRNYMREKRSKQI
jgi:hypothetical protein